MKRRVLYLMVAILWAVGMCGCGSVKQAESTSVMMSQPLQTQGETTLSAASSSAKTEKAAATAATTLRQTTAVRQTQTTAEKNAFSVGTVTTTAPTAAGTTKAAAATFRACSATVENATWRYYLYTPSEPRAGMPLIVYLHGGSGKGDDLNLITAADGFPKYLQAGNLEDVRAYVLIPQLSAETAGWGNAAKAVRSLIEMTVTQYGIDKSNISLTGHSMGGTGTWSIAAAYPTLFARIAPLSGSVTNIQSAAAKLKNVPVRAFVGSADKIVDPASSKAMVAALQAVGGDAAVTVFDGADHFSVPRLAYLDTSIDLVSWLIGK